MMPPVAALTTLVSAVDWLMPLTFATVWWALWRSRVVGLEGWDLAIPLGLALAWGMLWSFVPAFAVMRLAPPPGGQAGAILGLLASLIGLLVIPHVRDFFRMARLERLVAIGPWRIVYGGLILSIGLNGGLPSQFFWSVALGDIAVGLWAVAILLGGSRISTGHLAAWNVIGAVDLTHALMLGALYLRGFFIANPELPALNLLPLAGVPVFLAIHIMTLWGLWARKRETVTK